MNSLRTPGARPRRPRLLHELEQGHWRRIAAPQPRSDDPGVSSASLLIPGDDRGEEPLGDGAVGHELGDLPAGVEVVAQREIDLPVRDLLGLFGLRGRRRDPLLDDQRRNQAPKQGQPRAGVAAQPPPLLPQRHQAPLRRSSRPSAASFSLTSSSDLRPKFLTLTTSSSVFCSRSPRVLIPARFRQLYGRTERSSSSTGMPAILLDSSACGPTTTSGPTAVPTNSRKSSISRRADSCSASSGRMLPSVHTSSTSRS